MVERISLNIPLMVVVFLSSFSSNVALQQGAQKPARLSPLFSSRSFVKPLPRWETPKKAVESVMLSNDHNSLKLVQRQDLGTYTVPPSVEGPRRNNEQHRDTMKFPTKSHPTSKDLGTLPSSDSSPITIPTPRTVLVNIGVLFALNSGFLNGLALSGVLGRTASVSSVTGTYTNSAVAFANGGSSAMLTVLATPFFYMLGSFVNGLCNPGGNVQSLDKIGLVQSAPLLLSGIMVLIASLVSSIFGKLVCLTLAMGLQNSWTSIIMTGNLLRTAHFSGLTSDFGTILGQTLRGNYANAYKLSVFAKLATSFWLGGMMSVVGVRSVAYMSPTNCLRFSSLLYFIAWSAVTAPVRTTVATIAMSMQRRVQTVLALYARRNVLKSDMVLPWRRHLR